MIYVALTLLWALFFVALYALELNERLHDQHALILSLRRRTVTARRQCRSALIRYDTLRNSSGELAAWNLSVEARNAYLEGRRYVILTRWWKRPLATRLRAGGALRWRVRVNGKP
jgi:hypothetical protein